MERGEEWRVGEQLAAVKAMTGVRPGAHGAVGAALAAPTFGPKMGVSDAIVHLFFNHCTNSLCRSSITI